MPGAGPIILFDKSALQTLTTDEAVWFDTFYMPSMTPLFFVETLADLEKEMKAGRTAEDFVGALAEKTPLGGGINIHHETLRLAELGGQKIEMRRFPVVSGGSRVATRDGKNTVVFDTAPEYLALSRWTDGHFLDLERQFAKDWRASLSNIDLDAIFAQGREIIKRVGRPGDLAAARALASDLLGKTSSRFVLEALKELKPTRASEFVINRWKKLGSPPIASIAPYTAHIFAVDLFFCRALGADLIGRERPTNKIDMAYLYYLPFCMVFTSRDKLHAKTARLFLNSDQVFVPGDELKADLAKLDEHFSKLPDEVKLRGVMSFKFRLDEESKSYVATLTSGLAAVLKDKAIQWEAENVGGRKPVSPEKKEQLEAVKRWFNNDWRRIEPKLRTSIVEGISVFLSLFDDSLSVKRTFCPPAQCYDPLANTDFKYGKPLPSFKWLIENGKVCALNFPIAMNPGLAKAIGVMMKLDFERAVLNRVPEMEANQERHFREVLFMCDEYQHFATVGESEPTGDEKFFSLSRQPKCIPIVATQSISSLKSALPGETWPTAAASRL